MDSEPGDFVVGVLMAVFGLIGLFLAARAADDEMYVFGLGLVAFAALFILGLIKRRYDRIDAAREMVRVRSDV